MRISIGLRDRVAAPSWVYFIRAGDHVKIGHTRNLVKRVRSIQTANVAAVAVLGVLPGSFDVERIVHARFAAFHIRGEWYEAAPAILEFAARCAPSPTPLRYEDVRASRLDVMLAALADVTEYVSRQLRDLRGEGHARVRHALTRSVRRIARRLKHAPDRSLERDPGVTIEFTDRPARRISRADRGTRHRA